MTSGDQGEEAVDGRQPPAQAAEVERVRRFTDWLPELGATTGSVVLNVTPNGRQLRARKSIRKGELVMHIPRAAMILVEDARASEIGRLILERGVKLTTYGALAAYLLDLRRRGAAWRPFIDVLPTSFAEHPFNFSEADLDYLQGSWILPDLVRRRARLDKEYHKLRECLPREYAFSREDYVWASCCAWTRVYTVSLAGHDTHALIPMGDMLDHEAHPNVRWIKEAKLGFILTAARDIDAGEPLTLHYWSASNARMFATFGFCLEHNPNDVALIRLPAMPPWHPCFELARALGAEHGAHRAFTVPAEHAHRAVHDMFAYLRLAALSEAQRATQATTGPFGAANEEEALASLALACRQRLREFPTTLAQDEALLRDPELPLRLHFAVRVRHGEKVVLGYFLALAEAGLAGGRSEEAVARFADYFAELDRHVPPVNA